MNEKKITEKPDRAKRMRNIITGSVVWTAIVVIVAFVVLDPSESVEMQLRMELSDQKVVAVPSENSTDPKIDQTDVGEISSAIELDPDSDSQSLTQPQKVETDSQTSSIVYENDTTNATGTTDSSESVQTASIPTASDTSTPTADEPQVSTVTEDADPATRPSGLGLFIQVAAFSKVENAQIKRQEISKDLFPVRVLEGDDGINLVLVGPYLTESEAKKVQSELNSKYQLEGSFLKYAEIETAKVAMTESTSDSTIHSVTAASTSSAEESDVLDGWYVRVGAYKNLGNAKTSRLRVEKLKLSTVVTREKEFNVLMVGPFQDENTAQTVKARISQELDIKDAYLVRVGS